MHSASVAMAWESDDCAKQMAAVLGQLPGEWLERAAGETRTPDLRITNASLYQLSYSGMLRHVSGVPLRWQGCCTRLGLPVHLPASGIQVTDRIFSRGINRPQFVQMRDLNDFQAIGVEITDDKLATRDRIHTIPDSEQDFDKG